MKYCLFFITALTGLSIAVFSQPSHAGRDSYIFSKNIGWTILESKTIDGWKDGAKKKQSGFEGCNFGRTIYFADGSHATCKSERFQRGYLPKAVILGKYLSIQGEKIPVFKMLVEGEEYDIE